MAGPEKGRGPEPLAVAASPASTPEALSAAAQAQLAQLREGREFLKEHNYDLGKYEGAPEPKEDQLSILEGGVDATEHKTGLKSKNWYKQKSEAADLLLEIYHANPSRLTQATQDLIAQHTSALQGLATQTDYQHSKMKDNFEVHHSHAEVFGAYGAYNIVLAFQRVLDMYEKDGASLKSNDKILIALSIGSKIDHRAERYARAYGVKTGGEEEPEPVPPVVPPVPPVVPPEPVPPLAPVTPPGLYISKPGEHMAGATRHPAGRGITSAGVQFDERTAKDFGSKILRENFETNALTGLMEGLSRIPEDLRSQVLGEFFAELGKEDPAKAAEAMREIMEMIRDGNNVTADVLYATFDAKIAEAKTPDEKTLWEVQKTFFEFSQGKIDPDQAQTVLRDAYQKLKALQTAALSPELKDMYEGTLTGLEQSMRNSLALDMVHTARRTLDGTFTEWKDVNNLEDSLEEIQERYAKSPDEVRSSLEGGVFSSDSDAEVYFSSVHVLEALRLLITYKYPQEAAKKKITNPVEYYYNELKKNNGNVLVVLPAGVTVTADNPLNPTSEFSFTGSINVGSMFLDAENELRLFDKYQQGREKMGADAVWNEGAFSGSNLAFGGYGGVLALSGKVFEAADLMNDQGELGATELLTLKKILDLEEQKHFDEARALAIDVLKLKLPPLTESEIKDKADKIEQKEGSKIKADFRQGLEANKITQATFASYNFMKPDGVTPYADLNEYLNDKTSAVLEEKAIIELYGEKANALDLNDPSLSAYEKASLEALQRVNGKGWWRPTAENLEWSKHIAQMLVEVAVVEALTAGLGTFVAGAATVGRAGAMGSRTLAMSRAMGAARLGMRGGERLRTWVAGTQRGARIAANPRAQWVGRHVAGLAEGRNFAYRGGMNLLHGGAFVEGMALMHGDWVDPSTAEGAYQIVMMGGTFWALGKMQQVLRGQTISAQKVAGTNPALGAANRVERILGTPLNNAANFVGRHVAPRLDALAARGRAGALAAGAAVAVPEIGAEIVAMRYATDAEEWLGVKAHELTGGAVGISETQRLAMQETEEWRKWGAAAATVLGLRMWRAGSERPSTPDGKIPAQLPEGRIVPGLPEGRRTPQLPEGKKQQALPEGQVARPPAALPEGTKLPKAHNVDFIALNISRNRQAMGEQGKNKGIPGETMYLGSEPVSLDAVLNFKVGGKRLREHYEEALKIQPESARAKRLSEIDRYAASRLIIASRGAAEFKSYDQAEASMNGIKADHPSFEFKIYQQGEKFYLVRVRRPRVVRRETTTETSDTAQPGPGRQTASDATRTPDTADAGPSRATVDRVRNGLEGWGSERFTTEAQARAMKRALEENNGTQYKDRLRVEKVGNEYDLVLDSQATVNVANQVKNELDGVGNATPFPRRDGPTGADTVRKNIEARFPELDGKLETKENPDGSFNIKKK